MLASIWLRGQRGHSACALTGPSPPCPPASRCFSADPPAAHHPRAHARGAPYGAASIRCHRLLELQQSAPAPRARAPFATTPYTPSLMYRPCRPCIRSADPPMLSSLPITNCNALQHVQVIGAMGAMDSVITVDPDPQADLKHVRAPPATHCRPAPLPACQLAAAGGWVCSCLPSCPSSLLVAAAGCGGGGGYDSTTQCAPCAPAALQHACPCPPAARLPFDLPVPALPCRLRRPRSS